MKQTLSDYDKKSIRWLLRDKYNLSDLEINQFFEKSDVEKVQGWVLAKAPSVPTLTKEQIKDINRVLSGEPVDYVIGSKDFLGCKIDLSKKPLIPRVETEYWVEKAIKDLKIENSKLKIADIFCGSGCIGIAVLKHVKNSHVTFADVSESCVEQTEINLQINNFQFSNTEKSQSKVIHSDVFENIDGKYDVIFANPPYVPNRYVQMSADLYYEPKVALLGGENGMVHIDKFLSTAKNYTSDSGVIYMEFGDNQEKLVEGIVKKYRFKNYKIKKDQFGRYRYLKINM